MHSRQFHQILHLPESKRFAEMEEGVKQLATSVATLEKDAADLAAAGRQQSAAVLRGFAEEEAAKVLIMLDVARAGWKDRGRVGSLMQRRFYDHLTRGLYVQVYEGRPADVKEVRELVDFLRTEYYLDGPTDVDWIFPNNILTRREESLYVDYIRYEDNTCSWTGPAERADIRQEIFGHSQRTSNVIRLVGAMHRVSLLTAQGFEAACAAWQGIALDDAFLWSAAYSLNDAVIKDLVGKGLDLSQDENAAAARYVRKNWIFPFFTLDFEKLKVKPADLKAERTRRQAKEMRLF